MSKQPNEKESPAQESAPVAAPAPQPAMPPYVAPVTSQPIVQYVNIVNQKSVDGLGGWLMFWLVAFALYGLGYMTFFFGVLATPDVFKESFGVVSVIFLPIMAVAFIGSAVLIAMRKKLAVLTSAAAFGTGALYWSTMMVISALKSDTPTAQKVPLIIGIVLTILVANGLYALYFFVSKRVKATLIN